MNQNIYDELRKCLAVLYGEGELKKIGSRYVYIKVDDTFSYNLQRNLLDSYKQLEEELVKIGSDYGHFAFGGDKHTLEPREVFANSNTVRWWYGNVPLSPSLADSVDTLIALYWHKGAIAS